MSVNGDDEEGPINVDTVPEEELEVPQGDGSGSPAPLPPPWVAIDGDEGIFYYNEETGESQWEPPTAVEEVFDDGLEAGDAPPEPLDSIDEEGLEAGVADDESFRAEENAINAIHAEEEALRVEEEATEQVREKAANHDPTQKQKSNADGRDIRERDRLRDRDRERERHRVPEQERRSRDRERQRERDRDCPRAKSGQVEEDVADHPPPVGPQLELIYNEVVQLGTDGGADNMGGRLVRATLPDTDPVIAVPAGAQATLSCAIGALFAVEAIIGPEGALKSSGASGGKAADNRGLPPDGQIFIDLLSLNDSWPGVDGVEYDGMLTVLFAASDVEEALFSAMHSLTSDAAEDNGQSKAGDESWLAEDVLARAQDLFPEITGELTEESLESTLETSALLEVLSASSEKDGRVRVLRRSVTSPLEESALRAFDVLARKKHLFTPLSSERPWRLVADEMRQVLGRMQDDLDRRLLEASPLFHFRYSEVRAHHVITLRKPPPLGRRRSKDRARESSRTEKTPGGASARHTSHASAHSRTSTRPLSERSPRRRRSADAVRGGRAAPSDRAGSADWDNRVSRSGSGRHTSGSGGGRPDPRDHPDHTGGSRSIDGGGSRAHDADQRRHSRREDGSRREEHGRREEHAPRDAPRRAEHSRDERRSEDIGRRGALRLTSPREKWQGTSRPRAEDGRGGSFWGDTRSRGEPPPRESRGHGESGRGSRNVDGPSRGADGPDRSGGGHYRSRSRRGHRDRDRTATSDRAYTGTRDHRSRSRRATRRSRNHSSSRRSRSGHGSRKASIEDRLQALLGSKGGAEAGGPPAPTTGVWKDPPPQQQAVATADGVGGPTPSPAAPATGTATTAPPRQPGRPGAASQPAPKPAQRPTGAQRAGTARLAGAPSAAGPTASANAATGVVTRGSAAKPRPPPGPPPAWARFGSDTAAAVASGLTSGHGVAKAPAPRGQNAGIRPPPGNSTAPRPQKFQPAPRATAPETGSVASRFTPAPKVGDKGVPYRVPLRPAPKYPGA